MVKEKRKTKLSAHRKLPVLTCLGYFWLLFESGGGSALALSLNGSPLGDAPVVGSGLLPPLRDTPLQRHLLVGGRGPAVTVAAQALGGSAVSTLSMSHGNKKVASVLRETRLPEERKPSRDGSLSIWFKESWFSSSLARLPAENPSDWHPSAAWCYEHAVGRKAEARAEGC